MHLWGEDTGIRLHDGLAIMSHRLIRGLVNAWPTAKPGFVNSRRARGAKAAGLRYERAFGKALGPDWWHGKWFQFQDRAGPGWCQPDFMRLVEGEIWVLECKYTWVAEGHGQIEELYRPVLEWVWPGRRVIGVVVCKILVPGMDAEPRATLNEALALARSGVPSALHWLGTGATITSDASHPPLRASASAA